MIALLAFLLAGVAHGKVYDRCELARELKFVHKAPDHQLAIWVCIAEHESQYNTSIVGHLSGDGSGDHGIFQINDYYWCSPPGKGYACGVTCAELEDDDISDDFICAQRIYREHKLLSGDGFKAWAVYTPHCKGPKADRYIKDCFDTSEGPKSISTSGVAFAHGFFDTAAGRENKEFSTSTSKPDAFLSFTPSSIINNQEFTFTSPKPSSFINNRFLTPTENFDLFFTPTSSPTFRPTTSSKTFTHTTTPTKSLSISHPNTRPTSTASTPTRSVFNFGRTFSTPSTRLSFNPTPSTTTYQPSNNNQPVRKPVFIINGVRWY